MFPLSLTDPLGCASNTSLPRFSTLLLRVVLSVVVLLAVSFPVIGAELVDVKGTVLIKNGQGKFKTYAPGMVIESGDLIMILQGAQATLVGDGCSKPLPTNNMYTVPASVCAPVAGAAAGAATASKSASTSDTAAVTGRLWNDLDGNLKMGANEPMMPGVQISLINSSCKVGIDCPVATSDIHGNFGFSALEPGSYQVAVARDDDSYEVIGTLVLVGGSTKSILVALSDSRYILIESSSRAAAYFNWGAVGAGVGFLILISDDDDFVPDRPVSP